MMKSRVYLFLNIFVVIAALVFFGKFLSATSFDLATNSLFLTLALLAFSIKLIAISFVSFLCFSRFESRIVGKLKWINIFTLSQLYGQFIPGTGVAYRFLVLKRDFDISYNKSLYSYSVFFVLSLVFYVATISIYLILTEFKENIIEATFSFVGLLFISVYFINFLSNTKIHFFNKYFNILRSICGEFSIKHWLHLVVIYLISVASLVLGYILLARCSGIIIGFEDGFVVYLAIQFLSYMPQVVPANIGVQEFALNLVSRLREAGIYDLLLYSSIIRILTLISSLFILLIGTVLSYLLDRRNQTS